MATHANYTAAIIGCGKVAATHARTYQRRECISLAAGVDIREDNLERFCDEFELSGRFTSVSDMLREVQPGIVSISTYMDSHLALLQDCIEAGVRGIICEKPLLKSPAELPRIRQLVHGTDTKIVVHHMRRYGLANLRAREILLNGDIGQLSMMVGVLENADLGEMGTHWIDMFRFFNGDAPMCNVMAQTHVGSSQHCGHAVEDAVVAWFEFANGCRSVFSGGSGAPLTGGIYTQLIGTAGLIQIEGEDDLVVTTREGLQRESLREVFPDSWHALGLETADPWWNYKSDLFLEDLLCWLEGGPAPGIALPAQIDTAEAYLAAYLSAIRGERVAIPLSNGDCELDEWPVEVLARRRRSDV